MSDEQPLNDESLSQVEDLLAGVDLRTEESERTRLLLACGRAEGRAELRRTLRRWQASAAALSVCLLTALIWQPAARIPDETSHTAENISEQHEASPPGSETIRPRDTSNEPLHAATDWSVWVEKSNSRPELAPVERDSVLPQRPTLMASSRIDLQSFLNE